MTGIKNNFTEIANLPADGLVCLCCLSYGGIGVQWKLFDDQVKLTVVCLKRLKVSGLRL